jgi:hypothetical protein
MSTHAARRPAAAPASSAAAILLRGTYVLFAIASLVNGIRMLGAPAAWWASIPGVEHTGALNPHLVRDFGVAYAVAGAVFAWCALHPARARFAHLALIAFVGAHAAVHVAEIAAGQLPAEHWRIDFPTVIAPALWLCILALPPVWRAAMGAPAARS